MCRFVPIAPSSSYLTTLRCLAGGFSPPSPLLVPLQTWLPRRAAPAHKHPASLQSSIHHLPVRRVNCQLGCPDVWQKRHERTPSAPLNSGLACPAAPACASIARLYAAIAAFLPAASRAVLPGYTHAPFVGRGAAAPALPHPLPPPRLPRSPVPPAVLQTTPPAAQSARISATESPAPRGLHTRQSCAPSQTHTFVPGRPGRATAPPHSSPTRAKAARKSRKGCLALARTTPGTRHKSGRGSRWSTALCKYGIRRERAR